MKTQVDKIEISAIIKDLLNNESYYKYKYRDGWICGFGNGCVAYIEDHKDRLSIEVEHHKTNGKLIELVDRVVDIVSQSSTKIDDQLSVDKCKWDELPDEMLLNIAKAKFGHIHATGRTDVIQTDIEKAVVNYYEILKHKFSINHENN